MLGIDKLGNDDRRFALFLLSRPFGKLVYPTNLRRGISDSKSILDTGLTCWDCELQVLVQQQSKKSQPRTDATSWLLKFLTKARVGHLASSTKDGKPLVVPICFAYQDNTFYSAIDQKPKRTKPAGLRRVSNIVDNPKVCLVVDEYNEDWRKLQYVIVQGTATILSRGSEHRAALSLLRRKYRQYRSMKLENRPIIKIKALRTITWRATPSDSLITTIQPKEYH